MAKTLPSTAGSVGSNPGQGVKIPHALRLKKKSSTKQEQYGNKFNKNFKMAHIQKKKDYMMI